MSDIDVLDNTLLQTVFEHLDAPTLLTSVALVSRRWRDVAHSQVRCGAYLFGCLGFPRFPGPVCWTQKPQAPHHAPRPRVQTLWMARLPPSLADHLRAAAGGSSGGAAVPPLHVLFCTLYHTNLLQVCATMQDGGQGGTEQPYNFCLPRQPITTVCQPPPYRISAE